MVDPRMPTDPVEPPFLATATRPGARLFAEAWDHLWPWRRGVAAPQPGLRAVSATFALAATVAWVLGALGELRAGALIAWWFGWSVYEVLIRLNAKRYVKDGPWWGRRFRKANAMDMLCYVGFKNLLIGAALFLALKSLGALVV